MRGDAVLSTPGFLSSAHESLQPRGTVDDVLLLRPFHLPPIPGAAAASPLNAGEPEPEPRRALRQPQHPGPPQSPHVTSAQPITAAPAYIKGAGCPGATPPGCPGGRASGRETGRAGRVERGASRPRSVGAGHPLRARGHVRESVSHCPPPAGLGARNLQAVPPPPGSPPCRGAPRDSRVTGSPSSTPSTCGELGALCPSGRSHGILPSPRNPVPRLPGTRACTRVCRWKNSLNPAPPKLGVGEPTLSTVVQIKKPTLSPKPRECVPGPYTSLFPSGELFLPSQPSGHKIMIKREEVKPALSEPRRKDLFKSSSTRIPLTSVTGQDLWVRRRCTQAWV